MVGGPTSPSLGLHLSDNGLRVVVSLCLGVPTCVEHTCGCNEKVGILGTHGLKCKKSRFSRHHAVNDIIARALNLANFPSMLVAGTGSTVGRPTSSPTA